MPNGLAAATGQDEQYETHPGLVSNTVAMLTSLSHFLWLLPLAALCSVAVLMVMKRRHAPAAATRCPLPVPASAPAAAPLDVHLCLNVLNRFAIALDGNERAQMGVEHLGDYLAANHRAARALGGERMREVRQVIDSYWQLAGWQGSRQAHAIVWHVQGEVTTAQGAGVLINALQHLLSTAGVDIEAPHLHIEVSGDATDAQCPQVATIRLGANASAEPMPSTPTASANTLSVRLPSSG